MTGNTDGYLLTAKSNRYLNVYGNANLNCMYFNWGYSDP